MKKSLKLASYLSALSSIFIIDSTQALMECPTLTKPELQQLCRWTGLKKVPLLKIQAGEVTTKEGITLVNKLGTCKELDSIRAFFTSDPQKTYPGDRTKNPLDPNNPLKGLCTYTINTFTIGKPAEKIGFEVTFPPEPEPEVIPPVKKKLKVVGGVDISTSPEIQDVEIKKEPLPSRPNPNERAKLPPPRPYRLPGAVEAEKAEAEKAELPPPRPPRRGLPAMQGEEVPSSRPPARKPPELPTKSALQSNEVEASQPQPPSRRPAIQSELEQRLQRQRALAEAQ